VKRLFGSGSSKRSDASFQPLADDELRAGLLREVDLFAGLSDADLKQISGSLPMATCLRGGLITSPDDDDERLYIVKSGRVRLYRLTADGRQLTLDILDKGRVVGRMNWLGQQLADTYAEAIQDALICSFTPAELQQLIDRHPAIGMNIIRYLSERLASSEREREIMAYRTVEQRLATRLLDLAGRFGQQTDTGLAHGSAPRYASPIMKQDLVVPTARHRAPSAADLLSRLEGEPSACTQRGAAA